MPAGAIPFPFGDCRICVDRATGVHYGVATCEGCKGFFKRSITKGDKYKCFFGGQCVLSPQNRNRCKACRYQRCLQMGMAVKAVKMGRIPKVDKERALAACRQDEEVRIQQQRSVGLLQRMYPDTFSPEPSGAELSTSYSSSVEQPSAANPARAADDTVNNLVPAANMMSGAQTGHYSTDVIRELMSQVIERGHGQQLQDTVRQLLSSVQRQDRGHCPESSLYTTGYPPTSECATNELALDDENNKRKALESVGFNSPINVVSPTTKRPPSLPSTQNDAVSSTTGLMEHHHHRLKQELDQRGAIIQDVFADAGISAWQQPCQPDTLSLGRKPQPTCPMYGTSPQPSPIQQTVGVACFDPHEFDQYLYPRQTPDAVHMENTDGGDSEEFGASSSGTNAPGIQRADVSTRSTTEIDSGRLSLYEDTLRHLTIATEVHRKWIEKQEHEMRQEFSGALPVAPLNQVSHPSRKQVAFVWNQLEAHVVETKEIILAFCDDIPGFRNLDSKDQAILAESSYFEIYVIQNSVLMHNGDSYIRLPCGARYSRAWMRHFLSETFVDDLFQCVQELNACQLTSLELTILCAIQLTSPDRKALTRAHEVKLLHDHYLDILAYQISLNHSSNQSRILVDIFRFMSMLSPISTEQARVSSALRTLDVHPKLSESLSEENLPYDRDDQAPCQPQTRTATSME